MNNLRRLSRREAASAAIISKTYGATRLRLRKV
jgi:hypothetical protein